MIPRTIVHAQKILISEIISKKEKFSVVNLVLEQFQESL